MTVFRLALRARPSAAAARRRHAVRRWTAAALLPLALFAFAARAEKGDKEKPINYSADAGDVNYQTKIGTLTGNVIITQGTLTIHADKIVLKQNPDNSMSASAFGNPVTFRQKRDGARRIFRRLRAARRVRRHEAIPRALRSRAAAPRPGRDPQQLHHLQRRDRDVQGGRPGGEPGRADRGRPRRARARRVPAEVRFAAREGRQGRGARGRRRLPRRTPPRCAQSRAPAGAPLTLKPAGELAPPVSK